MRARRNEHAVATKRGICRERAHSNHHAQINCRALQPFPSQRHLKVTRVDEHLFECRERSVMSFESIEAVAARNSRDSLARRVAFVALSAAAMVADVRERRRRARGEQAHRELLRSQSVEPVGCEPSSMRGCVAPRKSFAATFERDSAQSPRAQRVRIEAAVERSGAVSTTTLSQRCTRGVAHARRRQRRGQPAARLIGTSESRSSAVDTGDLHRRRHRAANRCRRSDVTRSRAWRRR